MAEDLRLPLVSAPASARPAEPSARPVGPAGAGGVAGSADPVAWPEMVGLFVLFVLYTRVSDLYRPAGWPLSGLQAVVALALAVVVYDRLVRRRAGLVMDRVFGWMVAYGAVMLLSILVAAPVAHPAELVRRAAGFVVLDWHVREILILFALTNLFTTIAAPRHATWALMAGAAVLAAAGLLQLATGHTLGGLSSGNVYHITGDVRDTRLTGTLLDANAFAQMLVIVVPLALYRTWSEPRLALRLAALVILLLLAVAIVWTFSRTGFAGLAVVVGIAATWQRFRPARMLPVGLFLVAMALAAPGTYWERVGSAAPYAISAVGRVVAGVGLSGGPTATDQPAGTEPASATAGAGEPNPGAASASAPIPETARSVTSGAGSTPVGQPAGPSSSPREARAELPGMDESLLFRSKLWQVGLQMFLEHPLLGTGRGTYYDTYLLSYRRVDPRLSASPAGPHNVPVHIAAETGIVGLAAFAVTVAVAVLGLRDARRRFVRLGLGQAATTLEAVEVAIYGYLVTAMFVNDNIYQRLLWLLVALAAVGRQVSIRLEADRRTDAATAELPSEMTDGALPARP